MFSGSESHRSSGQTAVLCGKAHHDIEARGRRISYHVVWSGMENVPVIAGLAKRATIEAEIAELEQEIRRTDPS